MIRIDNPKLEKDIVIYCEMNEIDDINAFMSGLLKKAFMVEKYGDKPCQETIKTEVIVSPPISPPIETIGTEEGMKTEMMSENKEEEVVNKKKRKRTLK